MSGAVAIIGGTGAVGTGLALRWAEAGIAVVIGSRDSERARSAAAQIMQRVPSAACSGLENAEASAAADIVVLTAPLAAQVETLKAIAGSLREGAILVDTTVPLEKTAGGRLSRALTLWEGSAAERAARVLRSRPVHPAAAFHTLSATKLADLSREVDSDVLVCADDPGARRRVVELASHIRGARGVDAGPLENARYAEQLAAMLIALNLHHKTRGAGFRTTGLPCG